MVANARKLLAEPMPELTEAIYREYKEQGTARSTTMMCAMHAMAGSRRWCWPNASRIAVSSSRHWKRRSRASVRSRLGCNVDDPDLANWQGKTVQIDLGSILPAHAMAQTQYMLGGKLSDGIRKRMATVCRQRILDPLRSDHG